MNRLLGIWLAVSLAIRASDLALVERASIRRPRFHMRCQLALRNHTSLYRDFVDLPMTCLRISHNTKEQIYCLARDSKKAVLAGPQLCSIGTLYLEYIHTSSWPAVEAIVRKIPVLYLCCVVLKRCR